MDIKELLKKQWKIDVAFEKLKWLNNLHNTFIDSKRKNKAEKTNIKTNSEGKKFAIIWNIRMFATIIIVLLLLSETIGIAVYLVLLFLINVIYITATNVEKKYFLSKETLKDSKTKVDSFNDEKVYSDLCDQRELYHQLVKEQKDNIAALDSETYDEYMQVLNEYTQVVEAIKQKYMEDNSKEIYLKIKDEDPVKLVLDNSNLK